MPSLNHIHQYQRIKHQKLWKCAHPLCTWQGDKSLIEGKACICNSCGEVIGALSNEQLKRAEPKCINCMDTKEGREFRETKKKLEELGME